MFNPFLFVWYVIQILFGTRSNDTQQQHIAIIDTDLFHAMNPLRSNSSPHYTHSVRVTYKKDDPPKRDIKEEFRAWRENNARLYLTT